ncbi:MAG: DUF4080 domain-containing protein [Ruminococcaceae bacterium]|nr:DUF4080 domain-containing protein [Oscillospiraceae bacterium]
MLLVGINAKFIHSNLAIRYLTRMDERCSFREYTIADRAEHIAADLYSTGETMFFFSCYIWNMEMVYHVCEILKKANPAVCIGLAGPEVSFDPEEQMGTHPYIDYVLCGEGEPSISLFLDGVDSGNFSRVPGCWYRHGDTLKHSDVSAQEASMDALPFPYTDEDMMTLRHRIVYFETSRGCPYRCAFCLSGSAGNLRFLSLPKVEAAIDFFARHKVPLVKFVDRTFNADPERAIAIIDAIKRRGGGTTYHFEIRAETMTEALIQSLQDAPKGMFQLEIGVQSTNAETLERINRKPAFEKLCQVVHALSQNKNIHLHLDLIAGLPGESLQEFIHSFHQVVALRPQKLQLGFLKKLKGASLQVSGSEFWSFPPYEVIHSDAMSYGDLLRLKSAEEMLERYYNSGAFTTTIWYILETYYRGQEFNFFSEMADFSASQGEAKGQKTWFEQLYLFSSKRFNDPDIGYTIIYDYCLHHRDSLSFMKSGDHLKEKAFTFLKKPERVALYFEHYAGEKPVKVYKKLRFVPIGHRVFAFDYDNKRAADVTVEFE